MEIKFVSVEEIDRLIEEFSSEEKEQLASLIFAKLSTEARSRVLGLGKSGLTVVTGSFVSLNSEVAVNIQNSNSGFDAEKIIQAMIEWRKTKKL